MKKYPFYTIAIAGLFLLAIDLIAFSGVELLTQHLSAWLQEFVYTLYWMISLSIILGIFYTTLTFKAQYNQRYHMLALRVTGISMISAITKAAFAVVYGTSAVSELMASVTPATNIGVLAEHIANHKETVTQLGAVFAGIPFVAFTYGMIKGKFKFKVFSESFEFKHLPSSFDGFKIVQISDLHLGSFNHKFHKLEPAIERINELKPDLIVFTGDMVNNYVEETHGWQHVLGKLDARYGKYAILGNHDYGDYGEWESEADKAANFRGITNFIEQCGFTLLRNDSKELEINGESISLIGVENWGKPPFKQYGDLQKAMESVNPSGFQLLLSHDPTHWDAEVLGKTNIALTLAGHTHGAQLGVEVGKMKISPIRMKFKRWAGTYREEDQQLYVNRGLGYLGFSGRVGVLPEISELTLRKAL